MSPYGVTRPQWVKTGAIVIQSNITRHDIELSNAITNIEQIKLRTDTPPHNWPKRASYGVSIVGILNKFNSIIMAQHYDTHLFTIVCQLLIPVKELGSGFLSSLPITFCPPEQIPQSHEALLPSKHTRATAALLWNEKYACTNKGFFLFDLIWFEIILTWCNIYFETLFKFFAFAPTTTEILSRSCHFSFSYKYKK